MMTPPLRILALAIACSVLSLAMTAQASPVPPTDTKPPWSELAKARGQKLSRQGAGLPTGWYFPPAPGALHRGSIVCLHGIQTHGEWFAPLAEELTARGYAVYCPDRKYSGHHPENNGIARIESKDTKESWLGDVNAVITAARSHGKPVYLLGTSWGAKLALGVAACHPQQVDGTIMLVPALATTKETLAEKLKVLFWGVFDKERPLALPLAPADYVKVHKEQTPLSSKDEQQFIQNMSKDDLLLQQATARFQMTARDLQKTSLKQLKKTRSEQRPVLILLAEGDKIVKNEASRKILTDNFPAVSQKHLPKGGPGVQILRPADIAGEIDAWIRDPNKGATSP